MKLSTPTPASDFTVTTLSNQSISLSDFKGKRVLLSFFRNGACAMCNLRVHELNSRFQEFQQKNISILGVFESSREDMLPYVGQQKLAFELIPDPEGKLYELYRLESSEEKINRVIQSGLAEKRIKEAAANGFVLTPQAGSNFFRLPADFLIDENFVIQKAHYADMIIDHLPIDEITNFWQNG